MRWKKGLDPIIKEDIQKESLFWRKFDIVYDRYVLFDEQDCIHMWSFQKQIYKHFKLLQLKTGIVYNKNILNMKQTCKVKLIKYAPISTKTFKICIKTLL